ERAPAVPLSLRLARGRRFLQAGGGAVTASARGTAVHTVLEHLDAQGPLGADGIRAQVEAMVAGGRLAPEQAAAADAHQPAHSFASSLGQRLRRHAGQLLREVPFTLALPAAEVYPELDPALAAEERVVVQGVIDALLPTEQGLVLIDFKTDAVPAAG